MIIRPFEPKDTEAVISLWESAGLTRPWNDPRLDIARKATVQPELFLVAVSESQTILGTVMAGYEGHRGWMNYLATHRDARGIGVGKALVTYVEIALQALGCPKVNLQVRTSNLEAVEFYRHLGYEPDEAISLGKRLIAD